MLRVILGRIYIIDLQLIPIHVPSLNDRREDIPLLVDHFLNQLSEDHGILIPEVEDSAMKLIQKADWTGNVRELRNVVETFDFNSNGRKNF